MGYRKNFRTFVITYKGEHPLAGFECNVKALPLGETLDLQTRGYELRQHESGSPGYRKAMDELFAQFAGQIESWNVEDEETGLPIVPSQSAMYTEFEGDLGQDIILDWIDISNGKVSDPKEPKPLNSGPQFPGESLPMAPLS